MSASENEALIRRFYEAFARRDGEAMAACYHPEARFSDPAFEALQGAEPGHMWRMLTSRAPDLEVTFSDVRASDTEGSATWRATYTFAPTKRHVINHVKASFTFRDGLILTHNDAFDFHTWSKQALGLPGFLLGWSSFLQGKVRAQAMAGLRAWERKHVSAS